MSITPNITAFAVRKRNNVPIYKSIWRREEAARGAVSEVTQEFFSFKKCLGNSD